MSTPAGVGQEITPSSPGAVAPAPMPSPDATAEPTVETLRAQLAAKEKQIDELRSIKDREIGTVSKQASEAQKQAEALQARLAAAEQAQFDLWAKQADPDAVAKAKAERENYEREDLKRRAGWAQWDAYRVRVALREGLTEADVSGANSQAELDAIVQRKKLEKEKATSEDAIRQKVLAELKAKGINVDGPPSPKSPPDPGAAPSSHRKATAEDVAAAKERFAARPRDAKALEEYERVVKEYTASS